MRLCRVGCFLTRRLDSSQLPEKAFGVVLERFAAKGASSAQIELIFAEMRASKCPPSTRTYLGNGMSLLQFCRLTRVAFCRCSAEPRERRSWQRQRVPAAVWHAEEERTAPAD